MARRFRVFDVFSDRALAGNPLAVVLDAEGLDDGAMAAIAREFNLSETVFVLPPDMPHHNARVRIFTPTRELPFAGHPTVGTAICLALEKRGAAGPTDFVIVLEEGVGPVRCGVRAGNGVPFAEFDCPKLPEESGNAPDAGLVARALGVDPSEIGFENHRPSGWSAGVPFAFVPIRNIAALAGLAPRAGADWRAAFGGTGAFVYARHAPEHERDFRARMFAPELGIPEDPATGAAIAAFAGVLGRFDAPLDGDHRILVEQGVEMGRPSLVALGLSVEDGAVTGVRIGGEAVLVMEGLLRV